MHALQGIHRWAVFSTPQAAAQWLQKTLGHLSSPTELIQIWVLNFILFLRARGALISVKLQWIEHRNWGPIDRRIRPGRPRRQQTFESFARPTIEARDLKLTPINADGRVPCQGEARSETFDRAAQRRVALADAESERRSWRISRRSEHVSTIQTCKEWRP